MITANPTPVSCTGEDQVSRSIPALAKCWSTDEAQFNYNSLSGLLQAYDALRAGDTVYVADQVGPTLARLCDADDIITILRDRAADFAGEGVEDFPDVTDEEKKLLEAAVHGWIALCCPPTFWGVENVRRHVVTDADLDAAKRAAIGGES